MTDIRTTFVDLGGADFDIGDIGLATDDSLATAVLISLFTDRRAEPGDDFPGDDPRGWWADVVGSRLWLLFREKQTQAVALRAQRYASEALKWLLDDGEATALDVEATWASLGVLQLAITITLAAGERTQIIVQDSAT